MKLHPRARLTIDLDQEHTAMLDSMRGKEPRNHVARRLIELALQDDAIAHGASPIGPRVAE